MKNILILILFLPAISFAQEDNCKVVMSSNSISADCKDDGCNLFGPDFNCPLDDFSLIIYNRWGEEVFQSNDPSKKWKVKSSTEIGTYIWALKYKFEDGELLDHKGHVTVLK